MIPFKKRGAAPEPEPVVESPSGTGGKGRPTPKRREAEARHMRPIVPADRKTARAKARQERDELLMRQREALRTGDERYLPARDKGPVKRYVRDYIDARFSVGEFFIPLSVVLMLLAFGFQRWMVGVGLVVMLSFYGVFLVAVCDAVLCWFVLRRKLNDKFGKDKMETQRGIFFYVFGRCLTVRRWRQPKPQVGRREFPS